MIIRVEQPADIEAISAITRAAFQGHPHSHGTEAFIVIALRAADALTVSLVAETGGEVVGHVAGSPVSISGAPSGWCGLGPLSVAPVHQRTGIGQRLMREAIARLEVQGVRGCVLVGDPAYYTRFGFRAIPGLTCPGIPAEYVLALPLRGETARGEVQFHAAFSVTG